jgi:UPF0755 protein
MKSNKKVINRFAIFSLVVIAIGVFLWLWWKDSVSPVNLDEKTQVTFEIKKGEGVRTIAANLAQANLIRSPIAFFVLVKITGIERQLQAGEYRLSRDMDTSEISKELTHGITDIWITTLEGWRSEEIATKLTKELDIPESEFLKYSQEGYMFPDTYLLPRDATAGAVAQIFMNNFHKKIPDSLLSQATKNKLTESGVVILASIVEREGRSDQDRPVIAGILLNRLSLNMPLQTDATLQYALGYDSREKSWWRKTITEADKSVESPFNTYKYVGLPPKAIANPGLSAIKAVLSPVKTDYLYYLHDTNGVAHFAKTLAEHTANVSKYLSY